MYWLAVCISELYFQNAGALSVLKTAWGAGTTEPL
jgi:hypothetical protein